MQHQPYEGAFDVIDANGTDGTAAFQLPNPDPENDGQTEYTVLARPLGTPGGTSTKTTCATDPMTGLVVCSDAYYVAFKPKGQSSFTNVSNELLYLYLTLMVMAYLKDIHYSMRDCRTTSGSMTTTV